MDAFLRKDNGGLEPPSAATEGQDPIGELRRLLFVPEHAQVAKLQERLDDPEIHAEDVSRVLPEAIAIRATKDRELTRAMLPTVEEAILSSVRRDPHVLVDALFPVMGPAIRKAISSALESMIESLNETLERSFTVQGLKWRWEAFRTGRPLPQVILLRTLVYRVEQVFLIHRRTGLLLQHVSSTSAGVQDADMVSGMLTAIRDFVQDSFGGNREESLDSFKVGELTIRIEQGPEAVLAEAIETIHLEQAEALVKFEGDATPFERARPRLEACLKTQQRSRAERAPGAKTRRARAFLRASLVVLLIGVAVWSFFALQRGRRWGAYLERLSAEPGIAVTDSGRRNGRYYVTGLRDPLAADPAALLDSSKLGKGSVAAEWKPYQSLDSELVAARARRVLQPPGTVTLTAANGVLAARGSAPHRWIVEARSLSRAFAGVTRFDDSGLTDTDLAEIESLRKEIESQPITFDLASAELRPRDAGRLGELSRDLSRLAEAAGRVGRTVRVEVVGRGDSTGTEEVNRTISRLRAQRVASLLAAGDTRGVLFVPRGAGSSEPLRREMTDEDREINRSVTLSIGITPAPAREPSTQ